MESGDLFRGSFDEESTSAFFYINSRIICSDKKDESCEGFIDGDIIESFLDLDR